MTTTRLFLIGTATLLILGSMVFFLAKDAPEQVLEKNQPEQQTISVTAKPARELKTILSEERLPGMIVAENETTIVAETSGTISLAPFEVGDTVSLGETLVSITNPESSVVSKSGFRSESLRQAEIDASLARKAYKEAKRLAEKNETKESRFDRDLAKLRLESAEIALANATNASLVRSTTWGIVTEKSVDVGTSVTSGTVIARIALGKTLEARFHISDSTRRSLKNGTEVTVETPDKKTRTARITSIGTIADSATGKFPVQATLSQNTDADEILFANTPVRVIIRSETTAKDSDIILPLSALTTNQDSSFFFIVDNETAKKIPTTSLTVSGETALVQTDISEDARVIIESAGALEDGMKIKERKE